MNLRNICLPLNLAGLDIYIGNIEYCNKGLGAIIINQFLDRNVFDKFTACLVDPKRANLIAISSYKKAGFGNVQMNFDDKVNYMIKKRY
jgi:aminoglycoside 6'-N-acetyltransferase